MVRMPSNGLYAWMSEFMLTFTLAAGRILEMNLFHDRAQQGSCGRKFLRQFPVNATCLERLDGYFAQFALFRLKAIHNRGERSELQE